MKAAVAVIISLFIILSIFPTIYNIVRTPSNTFYTYAYNFVPDYFQYISWMKDGEGGKLALTTRFTPEEFPRKLGHTFFPILGFIGSRLGVNLFVTFTLSRVFLGAIQLIAIYKLITYFFPTNKKKLIAFFLTISLPSFLALNISGNRLEPKFFLPGITNFDVLRRLTFLPHHLAAGILVVLFFIIFAKGLEKDRKKYSLLAGMLLLIASFINPAVIVNLTLILAVAFGLLAFTTHKNRVSSLIMHFGLVMIFLMATAAYYYFFLFPYFPWNRFYEAEMSYKLPGQLTDFLGALGLALPLSLLGLPGKKPVHKILYILLVAWGLVPITGFILADYIPFFSKLRIFQSQQFIPLGILSAIGILGILEKCKSQRHAKPRTESPNLPFISRLKSGAFWYWGKICPWLIALLLIALSLPYYILTIKDQLNEVPTNSYSDYLPNDTLTTFGYLDRISQKESVVMTGFYTGQMLPAFTSNRVFLAYGDRTYDYDKKLVLLQKFFENSLDSKQLMVLLEKYNISYVLFTPDTPPASSHKILQAAGTKLIYQKGANTLFQVSY